uniref:Uncharacterized protein n=1 Tax=Arundo donax TaxID=35708 RepID=A0A0A9DQ63_ARUDO
MRCTRLQLPMILLEGTLYLHQSSEYSCGLVMRDKVMIRLHLLLRSYPLVLD